MEAQCESKTWFVPGRDLDNRSRARRSTVAELSDSCNTSAPGRTAQSLNGGSLPQWSRDGKELYFIAPDQKLMTVEIKSGPSEKVRPNLYSPRASL